MSLPFLEDKKHIVAMIMGKRHPDGSVEVGNPDGSEIDGMQSAALHLIEAIHNKDKMAVSEALKMAFMELLNQHEMAEGEESKEGML